MVCADFHHLTGHYLPAPSRHRFSKQQDQPCQLSVVVEDGGYRTAYRMLPLASDQDRRIRKGEVLIVCERTVGERSSGHAQNVVEPAARRLFAGPSRDVLGCRVKSCDATFGIGGYDTVSHLRQDELHPAGNSRQAYGGLMSLFVPGARSGVAHWPAVPFHLDHPSFAFVGRPGAF